MLVWNHERGWVCPAFPTLRPNEFVLALRSSTGKSGVLVEEYLQERGFMNQLTYLGRNGAKDYEKCMLLYPLRIYEVALDSDDFEEEEGWAIDGSNTQLAEDIAKLASDRFIPMASIVVVTPELQKLLTSF